MTTPSGVSHMVQLPSDPGLADWTATLAAYADRLTRVGEAMATGEPSSVPPFEPPPDLGAIPARLLPHAWHLLERSQQLERTITEAQAAVRARLDAPAPTPRAPARASRLDVAI